MSSLDSAIAGTVVLFPDPGVCPLPCGLNHQWRELPALSLAEREKCRGRELSRLFSIGIRQRPYRNEALRYVH